MTYMPDVSRRSFIVGATAAGGGLAIGFHLPGKDAVAAEAAAQGHEVNAWIMVHPDNTITLRVHRSEMGQGSFTAIPQLLAEELEADWQKVRAEFALAHRQLTDNKVYVSMATGGSRAIRDSQTYVRQAGAVAREMLIAAGAAQWKVPAGDCRAEKSYVIHPPSGRKLSYGVLAAAAAKITPPKDVKLKPDNAWKIAGTSVPRFDIPAKTDGSAVFGIDVKLPGMVYAVPRQCPVFGGTVKSYDESKIKGMPGVIGVVAIPNGVAVVAEHFWQAKTAVETLPIEWDIGPNGAVSSATIGERLTKGADEDPGAKVRHEGDFDAAMAEAAKKIEAEYHAPFLDHATMEPMNCTVRVNGDHVEVWAPSQNAEGSLAAAAEAAGVPAQNVDVYLTYMGGGFGRRGRIDYVTQAATVAKKMAPRPVKLIWTREETTQHGFYRPVSMGRLSAGLDSSGMPIAYGHKIVGQSLLSTVFPARVKNGIDESSVEGTFDQPYKIPNVKFDYVMRNTHVPCGFWRSVGHSMNGWITESFMDEIAHAGGKDPVELRRTLLAGQHSWLNVLNLAAEKGDWGKPLPKNWGRGFAIHEGFGSIAAHVAEIEVTEKGDLVLHRLVAVIDCGHAVNPRNIAAQCEGNAVYGLTSLLYGAITIKDGRVEQSNFDDYQVMRLREMPKVETYITLTRGEWWGGVGEPGLPTALPAVCNAIFQITGKRIRQLPLAGQNLRST
jgi:isoquinoline 1-oxidoreductase beta subunit